MLLIGVMILFYCYVKHVGGIRWASRFYGIIHVRVKRWYCTFIVFVMCFNFFYLIIILVGEIRGIWDCGGVVWGCFIVTVMALYSLWKGWHSIIERYRCSSAIVAGGIRGASKGLSNIVAWLLLLYCIIMVLYSLW